jgi:cobalt-zinc-cadmium resistance protein CzcA
MIDKIIDFSIKRKLIVILFTLSIVSFGIYSLFNISIGAVPDITNNQVQVITVSSNLSTQEIEKFITAPVELEMSNLPGIKEIRSISKFGLSVVTIVFEEKIGTYLPRQLISEKIIAASENIPQGMGTPEMGPITTGLGEIYQYTLDVEDEYKDQYNAMDLRTIQDWIVKRQLAGIKGVVEVNSWGGFLKQYEVAINPDLLLSMNVSLDEVYNAIKNNSNISGGAYIEKTNKSYFIRGDGQIESIEDIENTFIKSENGHAILISHVADVRFGYANRFGAITANGEGEKVLGQVMMLKDANSSKVIKQVKERVAEIQKNLPEGVFINAFLDRSDLISKTTKTIIENLVLGSLIVIFVVILILGNIRSALIIASIIPLSLLFTISLMYLFGIDANLMSLGALDFGIIIDGAVIIVEFIALKLSLQSSKFNGIEAAERRKLMDKITAFGTSKMMNSAIFGQFIILIVFIPILSLSGVEGKMFKPMAMTFSFAIIGAMIFGFTWLPVASSLFLKPQKDKGLKISQLFMNFIYKSYEPSIKWACNHKKTVLSLSLAAFVFAAVIFARMGGEFVPTLDEGDFVIQPVLKTGTSLSETVETTTKMEKILMDKFPEVDQIVCRIGAAEVPTDPMSMEEIDMIIKLKPKNTWTSAKSKDELANLFKKELSVIPGIEYEFTQPIEMRFNELITGVRADIAIKIFGDDLDYLNAKANQIKDLIVDVSGADDVIIEKTEGLPQMVVEYKRDKIAYYGVDISTLNDYLSMAFGGKTAAEVYEGEKRFDLVLRLNADNRKNIENIKQLTIPLENGAQIPLEEFAGISISEGPAKISRENAHRMVVVSVNARNRDLKSVVEDIQLKVDKNINLEAGTYITYGGQFENLENATNRLLYAVPVALILIFIFLHFAFNSFKDTLLIFTAVPLSTVGGVVLLWLRGMPFSVSAGIGFIALFGIAVLNGIVLIEHFKDLRKEGVTNMRELILTGTKDRLRPVLLTASAAAMGFLPMAISTGAGAEVQRPLATVVIGGLITSTLLTMLVLPILFEIVYSNRISKYMSKVNNKSLGIFTAFFFVSSALFAQNNGLSPEQAVAIALENNSKIKAYELEVDKSAVNKKSAFSMDKTLFYYEFDENNIAANNYPLNIIGVEQNFSFPNVYAAKLNMLRKAEEISKAELKLQINDLEKNVIGEYYRIQFYKHQNLIFQNLDSLYSNFVIKSEIRYETGDISKLDLLNAKAKYQQLKIQINQNEQNSKIAYQKLKSLMQIDSSFSVPLLGNQLFNLNNNSVENSSKIELKKLETDYKNSQYSLEKKNLLPDLSLGYFIGSNSYDNAKYYQGFHIGLAVPLFYGGQKSAIKSSKIAVEISNNLQDNYLRMMKTQVLEKNSELQKYKELIDFYENTGHNLSDEIISTAVISYEMGQIDFFNFIQSIENAYQLKLDYIESLRKYNDLAIELNYLVK